MSIRYCEMRLGFFSHSAQRDIRSGLHSAFKFIPKVSDGVKVRVLCITGKFSVSVSENHVGGNVMLKQERAFPKLKDKH